jgi:FkbM family methyltransferase
MEPPIQAPQTQAFFFTPPLVTAAWGHIMEELWKSRIYDPYLPIRKEGSVALDIGANVGLVTYYLAQHFDKVYSLEPFSAHFNNLLRMLNFNRLTNVEPIKKAIHIKEGIFGFGSAGNNQTTKSLHMATWGGKEPEEQVETITFEKLFKDYEIEHIDLMKLDVEGSEIELLSHSGFRAVAPKIKTIVVERHGWTGRNPNQLDEALKNAGFKVGNIPNSADLLVATR